MTDPLETFRVQLVAIAVSVALIVLIVDLIRRRKLREQYSLLWLVAGAVMLLFSIWRGLLDTVAHFLGVAYAPSVLFLAALFFGILLLIHFNVAISTLGEQVKTLAQEIALLKTELPQEKAEKNEP
jgi:hypothetical protein